MPCLVKRGRFDHVVFKTNESVTCTYKACTAERVYAGIWNTEALVTAPAVTRGYLAGETWPLEVQSRLKRSRGYILTSGGPI